MHAHVIAHVFKIMKLVEFYSTHIPRNQAQTCNIKEQLGVVPVQFGVLMGNC